MDFEAEIGRLTAELKAVNRRSNEDFARSNPIGVRLLVDRARLHQCCQRWNTTLADVIRGIRSGMHYAYYAMPMPLDRAMELCERLGCKFEDIGSFVEWRDARTCIHLKDSY